MAPHLLLLLIGILSLGVPLYVLVPMPEELHRVTYDVVGSGCVLLGFIGLHQQRPEGRLGWRLVLFGYAGWVVGDLIWTAEQYLLPDRYPAPSDGVYLVSYLLLGAGVLALVRDRHRGRDSAALLDAAIITTGVGVLVGVFVIAPLTVDSSLSLAAKAVSSAYPLADLFLVGVIVRMYTAPGARTTSYQLLTGSLLLTLSADLLYDIAVLVSGEAASSRWTDGAWLTSYAMVAAAACVPSMKQLVEQGPETGPVPTRRRFAALAGGLMLPSVALLLDGATDGRVHWAVIGVGTLLLSCLVLIRMVGLLNVVQVQAVRLSALARSDPLTGAPNRRTWDHELARACGLSRERHVVLCVAMIDLDRFKDYNDTHGHQAGDELLGAAVAAWTALLPPQGLLARYGGEEFAVLVLDVEPRDMLELIARLRAATPAGQTFSAGIAAWDPRTEPSQAVAAADEALYAAKRAGRDRIHIHIHGDRAV